MKKIKVERNEFARENTRKALANLAKTKPMSLKEAIEQQKKNSKD